MLQVRQGYVHVWGDASPAAQIDAAAKPPMLVPELDPDAESAVLRDGTEPLHAGKRYLRGVGRSPVALSVPHDTLTGLCTHTQQKAGPTQRRYHSFLCI